MSEQSNSTYLSLGEGVSINDKAIMELIAHNPVAYGVIDENDKFIFWNKSYEKLHPKAFEATREKADNGTLRLQDLLRYEAKQDPDISDIDALVKRHYEDRQQENGISKERKFINSGWYRIDKYYMPSGALVIAGTDINQLKKTNAELLSTRAEAAELAELQSTISKAVVQGIVVFQMDKIAFHNQQLSTMFRFSDGEIQNGMSLSDFVKKMESRGGIQTDESTEDANQRIRDNIKNGQSYTVERKTACGRYFKVDASPDGQGGVVATYSDITDAKEREVRIQEAVVVAKNAERAKSEFLANMSHEIRTPMNGVMGMAELLATTELDSKQKMFTDVIVKSGASLLTIINDILDFSKIDAGQMTLVPAPFHLAEAIEDVATLVSSKVAEKDIEFCVRVDPKLPSMFVGDVGRIRQIMTNLVGNAVKFTEKGSIYVNVDGELSETDDGMNAKMRFSVQDSGIGIPYEQCESIFTKFNQVDTSSTRKHEGTGLGLSITSSLVDLMSGDIGVESTVGEGSTFWFSIELPVDQEFQKSAVIPGDLTGANILIIDDNEVNRSILSEQMTAWQFESAAANSGAEGLQFLKAAKQHNLPIDLVILDFQMPEMDGVEVLRKMRGDETLNAIPVLMLTSVDNAKTNTEFVELGAEANLTKPTRSSHLLETVLQVIANNRAFGTSIRNTQTTSSSEPSTPDVQQLPDNSAQITQTPAAQTCLDVLVAEDNEVNQIVFTQILEEIGVNYKIVGNGRLALEEYKSSPPRMILMDVSMPQMNGKQATSAIRMFEKQSDLKRTPIVGVTAHALTGDMESCLDAGMDDYLSKPVSPDKLRIKIEQWLKAPLTQAC